MDQTIINNIPNKPWIYLFKDKKDNILYIWKAKNLKNRVSQYFNPNSVRKQDMLNKADTVDFFVVKTESEALYLEDNLIKKNQPPFNNMLKGSNSYAYIKITNEDFPQIFITRNKIKDWSKYIWPKHNTIELKKFLQYLRYIIKRRWCKKTQFNQWKVCSDYHFWLCNWWCLVNAPLMNEGQGGAKKLNPPSLRSSSLQKGGTYESAKKEYSDIIKLIEQFFRWNTKPVEKEIKLQIQKAVNEENFERATRLRDIYLQIANLTEKQTVVLPKSISWYICQIKEISGWFVYIVLNFYEWKIIDVIINKQNKNDGDENSVLSVLGSELWNLEKIDSDNHIVLKNPKVKLNKTQTKEILSLMDWFIDSYIITQSFKDENLLNDILKDIQSKYKLNNFPYHMECVDISHLWWSRTSGGLSWFLWWIPNYKLYRKYKINAKASNDYEALKEVITKRFKDKEDLPDLFILDWWKGQLWILKDFLQENWFKKIFDKVDFVSLGKWSARKTWWKIKWEKEKIFYFDSEMRIQNIDLKYDQSDKTIVKLRDEAHRFANSYRKTQMKKWL